MKLLRVIVPALLITCLGCQTLSNLENTLMKVNVFSTQEEVEFGERFSKSIAKEVELSTDPEVTGLVTGVGKRVAAESPRTDVTYSFRVIDKPDEINAFAVPGGHIYVYTGLLNAVEDEAELAAVLAHEVGHVAAKHSMKQLTRKMGYDYISGILLGENAAAWQVTTTKLIGTMGFLKFSRSQETEADEIGADIMHAADYDPRAMVRFLGKLATKEQQEPSTVERMLATHPGPRERQTHLKLYIEREGYAAKPVQPPE